MPGCGDVGCRLDLVCLARGRLGQATAWCPRRRPRCANCESDLRRGPHPVRGGRISNTSRGLLIPQWLPAHVALTYFTGACFIVEGLAIIIGLYARLAATLSELEMGLFLALVWVPAM